MRIRSLTELSQFLEKDIVRRKRELTTLKLMVEGARRHEEVVLLRAGICLLYAHWEGFIKNAATAYVCFVVSQGLRLRDLAPNFLALGLLPNSRQWHQLSFGHQLHHARVHEQITNDFASQLSERFNVNCDEAINTQSNLNSKVFKEILLCVGFNSEDYATRDNVIDRKLVHFRHSVSHGESRRIQIDDYNLLHKTVIELIEQFRTDVENAAVLNKYRRNSLR